MNIDYVAAKAADILESRSDKYDNASQPVQTLTAGFWTTIIGARVTPRDVCIMMTLHKIARMMVDPADEDHYVDGVGYLSLAYALQMGEPDVDS